MKFSETSKDEFIGGKSVSYMPAGIGTGTTPNNPYNLTGTAGYNKWVKNMKGIAQTVGMELQKFMSKDKYKDFKKQIGKDITCKISKNIRNAVNNIYKELAEKN